MAEESHRISEKEHQDGILGPSVLPPQAEANLPSTAGQSDPKHTRKPTSKWLKTNKMNPLEWPGQRPDLRSCGMTLQRRIVLENPPMWLNSAKFPHGAVKDSLQVISKA